MRRWIGKLAVAICCAMTMTGTASAQSQSVLNTRDKAAQCRSIDKWIAITRELGGPKVMTGNMVMVAERRAMAPAFADDIFPRYFGKRYFALSNDEKRKIDKTLRHCSQNGKRYWYGTAGLSEAFQTRSDRYNIAGWHKEIRKHGEGATILAGKRASNIVEAERQRQADFIRTTNKVWTVNRAGKLFLDRPGFEIHAFKAHSHDFTKACNPNRRSFNSAVLIKDKTTRLNRALAESIFNNALIPLVKSICPQATHRISAQFFFKGVQLDDIARRFQTSKVSTRFDFVELPVLSLSKQLNTAYNDRGFRLAWFNNHKPSADAQPYYETLAGLTHIGRQEFKSDREWAAILQARAQRSARLTKAKADAVTLAGFTLQGGGGVGLITGVERDAHFKRNRRDLVEAVMGYSIAITSLCPSAKITGGTTIVSYESQSYLVDRYTGAKTPNGPLLRRTFLWPVDYYDIAKRAVNQGGAGLSSWLDGADQTVYYRDVQNMVARKGCGSKGLVAYHENLHSVASRIGGDWHDFTSIWALVSSIFKTQQ